MFVLTFTKRKILRLAALVLVILAAIGITIYAITSAVCVEAAAKKLPIYSVGRDDNNISLTFDCAWGNSNTDELIQILAEEDVKATFFVTGEFCDKYPEDILKLFKAGHEIQNHSDTHPHVAGMNINELIDDTRECARKIEMITGVEPTLYRAPYGEYDDNILMTIEGMGYSVIQWSVDSIDWQTPTPETIISRVTDNTTSGSILLFHNDLENTTEALPEVLRILGNDYEFVPVSELIYTENFHIDNNGMQTYDVNVIEQAYADLAVSGNESNLLIAKIAQSLTDTDIAEIRGSGITPSVYAKITPLLSEEELSDICAMTAGELDEAIEAYVSSTDIAVGGDEPMDISKGRAYFYDDDCEDIVVTTPGPVYDTDRDTPEESDAPVTDEDTTISADDPAVTTAVSTSTGNEAPAEDTTAAEDEVEIVPEEEEELVPDIEIDEEPEEEITIEPDESQEPEEPEETEPPSITETPVTEKAEN